MLCKSAVATADFGFGRNRPLGSASLFSYSPALQPRAQKMRLRAQSHKNQDKRAQKQRLCAQNWEIYVKQARKLRICARVQLQFSIFGSVMRLY